MNNEPKNRWETYMMAVKIDEQMRRYGTGAMVTAILIKVARQTQRTIGFL
jgi:hypothetical protein